MLESAIAIQLSDLSCDTVSVRPLSQRHQWSLRARNSDMPRLMDAWGAPLPTAPLSSEVLNDRIAFRLGPDEWLLIADSVDAAAGLAGLSHAAAFSVVDISDRDLTWSIEGANAARVLAAGCPLDFADAAFPVGRATRSVYGQAEVTLWRPSPKPEWHVRFLRSFRDYMTRHMTQSIASL